MKNKILLFAITVCLPFLLNAQKVELTPFGGYVFAGTMQGSYGDVRFRDNAQYGGMLSIAISRVMDLDFIYNRSDTKAEVNYYDALVTKYEVVPLSINYLHLGFTKNFRINRMVSPFVGFNLGACDFAPKENYSDLWFFSVGMNAGVKIYFTRRIGLRIQMQGMVPIQGSGATFFVGSGGSGGGLSLYSTLLQFGGTGGIIFRLGRL
jgi:hypothetical protein